MASGDDAVSAPAETRTPRTALLLDVGSTSVKGAIVDVETGRALTETHASTPAALTGLPTRHETDPQTMLAVVRGVAEELLSHPGAAPQQALLSTQMHSCLLTDRKNRPVSPILSWQDNRLLENTSCGRTHLESLAAQASPGLWESSGIAQRPGFGGGNLGLWLGENPDTGQADGLRIHTLGSFLSVSLGGPYATGLSNAASLGLVDVRATDWSEDLVALHALTGCELPDIIRRPSPCGIITVQGAEITWWGDLGDHQASVLGAGGLDDDELAISLGTAGIAARLADSPSSDPQVDSRPYIDGRYLLAVSRQPGGALASEFATLLGGVASHISGTTVSLGNVWARLAELPEAGRGPERLSISEEASGERRINLDSISPSAPLQSLYTGFLVHYAQAYQECVDLLFPAAGSRPTRLKFNGGFAARSEQLRTTLAESLDLKINDVPSGELALEGLRTLMMTSTQRRNHL